MRLSTIFLSVLITGLMLTSVSLSQDIGDYGSIASGNWGESATTWAAWDGTGFNTAVSSQPSSSVNVYVRNGHTVTLEGSGKNCKNLIIEEGGTLVSDTFMPTSSIRYVRVAGTSVTNNGTIGTLDDLNTVSFEIIDSTAFQGTGTSRICRVRPRTDSTNIHIVFDTDVKLTYVGGSGTGGVGLYTSNGASDNVTVTINSEKTVTCVNYCYVAIGSSGTGTGNATTTFNIDGSLILEGANTNMNLRNSMLTTLNVNGVLTTGRNLNTITTGLVPIINVDGVLTVESGTCDLSDPASVITGSGTVNILGNTDLQIGSAEGITTSGSTGAIQTAVRNFSTDGRFTYMGTAAQVTGNALPAIVDELTISNAEGVTLNGNIEILGALNLNSGILTTSEYSVKLGDGTDVNRTSGHVNGSLSLTVTGGGNPELFDIGDAVSYTPVTVIFGNVTTSGLLTAVSNSGSHPSISTSDITSYQNVDRYYTLTNDGIVYDNYSAEFTFVPEDLDEGADTAAFMVQKFASGTWSTPTVANPLATSIGITGEVGFGDFIIGEEKPPFLIIDYFRSKASGNWNDPAIWLSSPDNMAWIDATEAPYDTSNVITVKSGDTVTVTETISVDQVVVEENGVVVIEGSPVVFTVRDGVDDVDMTVSGKILVTGTAIASPGPYSFNAEGVIHFETSSAYEHNQNEGSLPDGVWKSGSTMIFTGAVNSLPGNRSQNFSNIVYNCPGQTSNLNMGYTDAEISGDITVVSTGSGRWQLCGPSAGSTAIVSILGDIIQSGGNFTSQGTGNSETTVIIHTFGNVTTTGGNFSVARGSQGGSGTTTWYLHGDLLMSNTATQNSNSSGAKFVFTGNGTHTLALDNVNFVGGFPVEVDTTELDLGLSEIHGSGIFTLSPLSMLLCANEGGLDSALQNTGTIDLSAEADYVFNGTSVQITGAKLPAEVNNLVINNTAGVTLSSDVTVNREVSMQAGSLIIDGKTVTLGSAASLVETGGNVTGTSGKITTTRDLNAPAAHNVAGMGAVITSAADLGATTVERLHSAAQGNSNTGIYRQFNFAPANNSSLNATLRFYYAESELNSIPEADLRIFSSPDGMENHWDMREGTINTAENYAEVTGLNSLSYWTLADVNHPVPVEMTSFSATSDQYAVILNWSTATEIQNRGWDIERRLVEEKEWQKIGFAEGKGNTTEPTKYQFRDTETLSGTYQYRLKQMDYNGAFSYSEVVEIDVNNMPLEFALYQNYPNPFNPETIIRFDLPEESFINLSVFNSIGEKVLTVVNEKLEKGRYSKTFNAVNLPSGIYIYRITSDNSVFTKKMMLIK